MKIQNRYCVIVLGLLVFQLQADESHDCVVSTFTPDYVFETKFTALALKAAATNTHFAAEAFPLPILSPNWQIHDICKKYHFAFDLLLRLQLHKADSALFANWQHFKNCDRTVYATDSNNMVGPFFEIGPDASAYFKAIGLVKFKFDEVNLDYGQNVNFGERLQTNFFIGASFVQIDETLSFSYIGKEVNVSRVILAPTQYQGFGPQCGIDFNYNVIKGLGLVGKVAASLLTGKSCNHTTYTSFTPELETLHSSNPNIQHTKVDRISLVVPSLFQRIGLAYLYEFCDHYMVKFEVGYQAQIYFNSLQIVDMGSEVITPPVGIGAVGVYARTFQRNMSNFALTGAYASMEFAF